MLYTCIIEITFKRDFIVMSAHLTVNVKRYALGPGNLPERGGLAWNILIKITDSPNMTSVVNCEHKASKQPKHTFCFDSFVLFSFTSLSRLCQLI